MTDNFEWKEWKLGSYIIMQHENSEWSWEQYVQYFTEPKEVTIQMGRAFIKEGVLLLKGWSFESATSDTYKDGEEYIASLPQWDKTKYYIPDGKRTLFYCNSGDEVPEEVATPIMEKLGYKKKVVTSYYYDNDARNDNDVEDNLTF